MRIGKGVARRAVEAKTSMIPPGRELSAGLDLVLAPVTSVDKASHQVLGSRFAPWWTTTGSVSSTLGPSLCKSARTGATTTPGECCETGPVRDTESPAALVAETHIVRSRRPWSRSRVIRVRKEVSPKLATARRLRHRGKVPDRARAARLLGPSRSRQARLETCSARRGLPARPIAPIREQRRRHRLHREARLWQPHRRAGPEGPRAAGGSSEAGSRPGVEPVNATSGPHTTGTRLRQRPIRPPLNQVPLGTRGAPQHVVRPGSRLGGLPTPIRIRANSRWRKCDWIERSPLWPAVPPPSLRRTTPGSRSSSS